MKSPEKRIFTVPNIISMLRILCIPFFVYFFYKENFITAGVILICSGITDFFDGALARKLNQVTELGKILDPISDKLTEAAIAVLLFMVFHNSEHEIYNSFLCWIFIFFIAKEGLMLLIGGILLLCKIKPVAAEIYGKISTFSFYVIMAALLVFGPEIGAIPRRYPNLAWMELPEWITVALVITAALLALVAFFSYFPPVYRHLKAAKAEKRRIQEAENLPASDEKTEEAEQASDEIIVTASEETIEEVEEIPEATAEETEEVVEEKASEEQEDKKDLVDTLLDDILSDIQKKEN